MNKEVKEILNNIKKQNEWNGIEYFKTPLSNKDAEKLLDYINQLETNIEEAIKFIDNNMYESYCYVGSEDKLKEILERGKE